jgi:hypothetical protein
MLSRNEVCKIAQGLTWLGTDLAVEDKDVGGQYCRPGY